MGFLKKKKNLQFAVDFYTTSKLQSTTALRSVNARRHELESLKLRLEMEVKLDLGNYCLDNIEQKMYKNMWKKTNLSVYLILCFNSSSRILPTGQTIETNVDVIGLLKGLRLLCFDKVNCIYIA